MNFSEDKIIHSVVVRNFLNDLELFGPDGYVEDELKELDELAKLNKWAEKSVSDWQYDASLISESYFTDYIQDYISEIYEESIKGLPDFLKNSFDWDAIADLLREDYSSYELNGVTFYGLTS